MKTCADCGGKLIHIYRCASCDTGEFARLRAIEKAAKAWGALWSDGWTDHKWQDEDPGVGLVVEAILAGRSPNGGKG